MMKYLYTMLLLISINANATNYYVSNSGSDAANGLTPATSWQTIAHVNAQTFSPGDSILFKRDDTWVEKLIPPSSGSVVSPIVFGAYDSGLSPIITGFQVQGGFTNAGNIWTATATNSVKQQNTVLINGNLGYKARTPNSGYSTYTGSSATQLTGTGLSGTPNYTGSQIVIRDAHWILDVCTITSQVTSTVNFNPAGTYTSLGPVLGANGYFIQNTVSDLDVAGEWQYDSASKVLKVYATSSPVVKISTIDTLVYLNHKDYITFDHIYFNGANKAAIRLDTSNHVTIQYSKINYSGWRGISGIHSHYCFVLYDTILNSQSNAVYLRQDDPYTPTLNTCDSSKMIGTYIQNTGVVAGMGESDNGHYFGVYMIGDKDSIYYNTVDSTGYVPIFWNGKNNWVYKNYVTNYCFTKDDGGGIYTVIGAYLTADFNDGSVVRKNIIKNGIGNTAGTDGNSYAPGIYSDNLTRNITIDSNSTYNTSYAGYFEYGDNSGITVKNNTFDDSLGSCIVAPGVANSSSSLIKKNNICYQRGSAFYSYNMILSDLTESIDSNYLLRPVAESTKMRLVSTNYSLSGWQANTGYDAHSRSTPTTIISNYGVFYSNPTLNNTTINPGSGYFVDPKGNYYSGAIILNSFSSLILFPSGNVSNSVSNNRYNKVK